MKVNVLIQPDTCTAYSCGASFPYERVVGLHYSDDTASQEKAPHPSRSRELDLPLLMAERLLAVTELISRQVKYNCHYFARFITGMEVNLREPFSIHEGSEVKDKVLALGEIGVIGSPDLYAEHSVVGFGSNEESLQITGPAGKLAIAQTADVLNFYNQLRPGYPQAIYRLASSEE